MDGFVLARVKKTEVSVQSLATTGAYSWKAGGVSAALSHSSPKVTENTCSALAMDS